MPEIHYLNVKNGDCSFIKHYDGKVSVIDVNNAFVATRKSRLLEQQQAKQIYAEQRAKGNFNQKNNPVNPIDYFKERGITDVFRFILTHPDMDHMDGIEDLFSVYPPTNFWDTDNTKDLADFSSGRFNESDWDYYKKLRDGDAGVNRLALYDGSKGKYFNQDENGKGGGNGLYILAPTHDLIKLANETEDWNDSSYVILYRVSDRKVLFCGDADNDTWDHLLANHENDIKDIDLLIAPHHGRKSSCSYEFLKVLMPKATFFGNADKSTHLAHDMFRKLGLYRITNNQGNSLIADIDSSDIDIYVTHERFAIQEHGSSKYNDRVKGYYVKTI